MKALRHLSALLLFSVLMTTSCYAPVSPDICGVHISCHFNGGYEDNMWILQVWVDHPIQLQDIREVEMYLYDAYGEKAIFL